MHIVQLCKPLATFLQQDQQFSAMQLTAVPITQSLQANIIQESTEP